jgi:hypothetical protein
MNAIEVSNKAKALIEAAGIKCENVVMSERGILIRPSVGYMEVAMAFAVGCGRFSSVEKKWNPVAGSDVIIAKW